MRKRRLELTVWAFLLSLAFYPGSYGFIAWFALVRPLMILSSLEARSAFRAAYFYSFCFNCFALYWIAQVTPPGTISAIALVASYYTVILLIFNRLYRFKPIYGIVALPFVWVGMEYFRTLTEIAFPWADLGYTQSYYLYILQIVSITSVHGLSFIILVVNVLLWQILRPQVALARKMTAGFLSVGMIVMLIAYGWAVMPVAPRPGTVPIVILQGSIPIEEKWHQGQEQISFKLYDSLAQTVTDSTAKLFIWPETAAPSYLSHAPQHRGIIGRTAAATNAYHLVGGLGATQLDDGYRHYNSAYYFGPDGHLIQRYDKMKLVPFTEQVPYQDYLPFLRKEFITEYLTFIETYDVQFWSDFYPGDSAQLFQMDEYLFGTLICYEVTFPEFVRQAILDGADFMVEITNDTWFGHSVGIHMHSQAFVTRAVENRCWMARAANSGLSYVVDGYGRIREELPLDAVAALPAAVRPLDGFSFFTEHGDLIGYVSFLITMLLATILATRWVLRKIFAR